MPLPEELYALKVRARYAVPAGTKGACSPHLPQQCPHPNRRARDLTYIRAEYAYLSQDRAVNPLSPIAVAGRFPLSEQYGLTWALPYLPQLLRSVVDAEVKKLWYGVRGLFGPVDKLEAFAGLFSPDLPAPPEVDDWRRDAVFARNRLDGPNPLLISRITDAAQLARTVGIDDPQFQSVMGATRSLADELRDGNLFVADFQLLQRSLLPQTEHRRDSRWRAKYLPAPVALFCQRAGVDSYCDLQPVAIRIDQTDAAPPNPLYLRGPGEDWLTAKTFVEIAEFNLQAMSSHIYRHHYLAEPFSVTTHRQLSPEHPLFVFLEPHLAYTLAVNGSAFDLLKQEGSIFDEIYAGELCETRAIMIESYKQWTVRDQALDSDLTARGVDSAPREYPFRDDGRLWLEPLQRFVEDYLKLYYHAIGDVQNDWELQAWARELVAPDGGNLRGLFEGDELVSVSQLAGVLAQFLFTVGPGHAAVHYPQTDYFTYIPAFPGAAYRPPAAAGDPITNDRFLATLPSISVGADQFLNNQIANYRFDRFGDYSAWPLSHVAAAQPAIARLRQELAGIEETITARNRTRPRPYTYLLPSLVPNSINI